MSKTPIPWIASLYFFQGIPYLFLSIIGLVFFQQQGISNAHATVLIGLLTIPWAIKPVFALFLENVSTRKRMTLVCQILIALIFLLLGWCATQSYYLMVSTFAFFALAIIATIHDIVSDGVYLLNLAENEQKKYVALRSIFYQLGGFVVKGGLFIWVGQWATDWQMPFWRLFFYGLLLISCVSIALNAINIPETETHSVKIKTHFPTMLRELFKHPSLYPAWLFLFVFIFTDAQMQKVVPLFLVDKHGLNLSLAQMGKIYGIVGGIALLLGIFISSTIMVRFTIQNCMKFASILLLMSHLPFIGLASYPLNSDLLYVVIVFSQMGLGVVSGTYMGYLLTVANRYSFSMTMYSLCTAIMAMGYSLFGAISGYIEQHLGYFHFFVYLIFANIVLVLITFRHMSHDE